MTIILVLLSVTLFIFSLLVIIVIMRNKTLHNSQSCYKISMAMSDIIVATLILPSIINNTWYYVYNSEQSVCVQQVLKPSGRYRPTFSLSLYIRMFTILTYSTGFITIFSLLFAAIDRLILVMYPLFYRSHNVEKISMYICIFIWIGSFSSTIVFLLKCKHSCYYYFLASLTLVGEDDVYLFMVYLVTISTFLILVLSLTTMFMLRSNNIKTNKIRLNTQQNKAYKAELRLAKNLMVIVFVFLIMVTPLLFCFWLFFT